MYLQRFHGDPSPFIRFVSVLKQDLYSNGLRLNIAVSHNVPGYYGKINTAPFQPGLYYLLLIFSSAAASGETVGWKILKIITFQVKFYSAEIKLLLYLKVHAHYLHASGK